METFNKHSAMDLRTFIFLIHWPEKQKKAKLHLDTGPLSQLCCCSKTALKHWSPNCVCLVPWTKLQLAMSEWVHGCTSVRPSFSLMPSLKTWVLAPTQFPSWLQRPTVWAHGCGCPCPLPTLGGSLVFLDCRLFSFAKLPWGDGTPPLLALGKLYWVSSQDIALLQVPVPGPIWSLMLAALLELVKLNHRICCSS